MILSFKTFSFFFFFFLLSKVLDCLPLKMFSYSIFTCIIGQVRNPKMSSLAYHCASTDSWRRLLFLRLHADLRFPGFRLLSSQNISNQRVTQLCTYQKKGFFFLICFRGTQTRLSVPLNSQVTVDRSLHSNSLSPSFLLSFFLSFTRTKT